VAKPFLREEARQLRAEGISVGAISTRLSVSKSSVSLWVRDIQLTNDQLEQLKNNHVQYGEQNKGAQTNKKVFKTLRMCYQETGRVKAKEGHPLHINGCMLYWAEGAKEANRFYFINSDPNMIRLMMRFLREEMNVSNTDITVRIHCHFNNPVEVSRVETYWLTVLGLESNSLRRTVYKEGSENREKRLPNGVCSIRVKNSVWLVQHVYGAIQEYSQTANSEWEF